MVYSYDRSGQQYKALSAAQAPRQEKIMDLKQMMAASRLPRFHAHYQLT
jgi:hypothetical protein